MDTPGRVGPGTRPIASRTRVIVASATWRAFDAPAAINSSTRLGAAAIERPTAAGEARLRVQDAMLEWVLRTSERQPLVLLIDDLQQADESSAAWFAARTIDSTSSSSIPLLRATPFG